MIPAIGMIIAAYTIARLLQVPLERSESKNRQWFLWTISLLAIMYITWFAAVLWFSGDRTLAR
jgi:hypothetical protein